MVAERSRLVATGDRGGQMVIFMDMANILHAAQDIGVKIDYVKLRSYLAQGGQLLRTYAYVVEDPENGRSRGFITWMRNNRFRVISKRLQRFPDGQAKGNVDIELAVDMLALAPYISCAILVSGDGDFTRLVEAVQDKGVWVIVAGFNGTVAQSLIKMADEFIELDRALPQIQLTNGCEDVNGRGALRLVK